MNALYSPHILIEAMSIASVAAISYASTNFDNLVVLSAYAVKSGYRPLFVKLTFVFVCLNVLLVSLALAQAADTLPKDKIRYLGLVPMGLGAYHLAKLMMRRSGAQGKAIDEPMGQLGLAGYLGFASALLANSSDSVVVMAPLLADLMPAFVLACFGAAVAVAILMSSMADLFASHPGLRSRFERISELALPILLIGIGVLIFTDNPSDIFVQ